MKALAGLCLLALLVVTAAPGFAGDGGATTHGNAMMTHGSNAVHSGTSSTVQTVADGVPGHYESEEVCAYQGDEACAEPALCADGVTHLLHVVFVAEGAGVTDAGYSCPKESVEDPVEITDKMVLRAFKRIPLPESELVVQPPGGETLVNFATNFYTEAGPFERSVTLVGQQVDLRIWPSRFDWAYGDGEQASTTEPGAAYPDLEVTHEYLSAGPVGPKVDTTYSAEFRVNGGAWAPVVGTVTMAGAPVGLQVRTATPTLVGY